MKGTNLRNGQMKKVIHNGTVFMWILEFCKYLI